MALTLWHNPRCSKSRAAKALLQERGVDFDLRLYLKEAPDAAEVTALAARVGRPLAEMLRTGEAAYKELGLKGAVEATLAEAVAAHPILLERPILDDGNRAVIGRPPEVILELL
jgi:arsenate reductase